MNTNLILSMATKLLTGLVIESFLFLSLFAQDSSRQKRCPESKSPQNASLASVSDATFKRLQFWNDNELEIKAATRKSEFRPNELITLDIALLNKSGGGLYTLQPNRNTVVVKLLDAKNNPILVGAYEVNQLGYTTTMYNFVGPGNFTSGHLNILAGCTLPDAYMKKLVDRVNRLADRPNEQNRVLFEEGMFHYWGDFCADVKKPGEYKFIVELKRSERVITFSRCKEVTRTLITGLRSEPILIKLIE